MVGRFGGHRAKIARTAVLLIWRSHGPSPREITFIKFGMSMPVPTQVFNAAAARRKFWFWIGPVTWPDRNAAFFTVLAGVLRTRAAL